MRAIKFTDDMVRAILEGKKTQTRRPITKITGIGQVTCFQQSDTPGYDWIMRDSRLRWNDFRHEDLLKRFPWGKIGDCIYVQEAWSMDGNARHIYRATSPDCTDGWHSSSTMSEGQSRLTLRIKSVRVERLWEIRSDDAIKEGFLERSPIDDFFIRWNGIYGKGPFRWGENPWVWVIDFEKESV